MHILINSVWFLAAEGFLSVGSVVGINLRQKMGVELLLTHRINRDPEVDKQSIGTEWINRPSFLLLDMETFWKAAESSNLCETLQQLLTARHVPRHRWLAKWNKIYARNLSNFLALHFVTHRITPRLNWLLILNKLKMQIWHRGLSRNYKSTQKVSLEFIRQEVTDCNIATLR